MDLQPPGCWLIREHQPRKPCSEGVETGALGPGGKMWQQQGKLCLQGCSKEGSLGFGHLTPSSQRPLLPSTPYPQVSAQYCPHSCFHRFLLSGTHVRSPVPSPPGTAHPQGQVSSVFLRLPPPPTPLSLSRPEGR